MIPILYEKDEVNFTNNGICRLPDIISGIVTEERNGMFVAEFEYPVEGRYYSEIKIGRIIYCSCSQNKAQPFEIYEASKPINKRVIFNARHLTYRANFMPVGPFTSGSVSAQEGLNALRQCAMEKPCDLTLESDIATLHVIKISEPTPLRACLGGMEGSILDLWGGEYEWDYDDFFHRPSIKLWDERGQNSGVTIRYGKNLTDLRQEESIENMITGIVAYWKDEDACVVSEVVKRNVGGQYTSFPRIGIVDMSGKYENKPTSATLTAAAEAYLDSHQIGIPKVSLKISFVDLTQTEEYKNSPLLERVKLCDTVTVKFEELGVDATAKVIKTVWDFINDRYESIELGDSRSSISSQIVEQDATVEQLEEEKAGYVDMTAAIKKATDLITGVTGGYVVIKQDASTGKPQEILIMDTEDEDTAQHIWRWNLMGLGYSPDGGVHYTEALTRDQNGVGYLNTQFIVANSLSGEKITGNSIDTAKLSVSAQQTIVKNSVTTVQYCLHTSPTTAPPSSATWYDDVPTWSTGKYVWIRYKTVKTLVDNTTDTTYTTAAYDSNTTVALSTATAADATANTANATANTANTTANNAIKEEQLIYKTAVSGTTTMSAPTSWITDTSGAQNTWSLKRPQYNSSYPVCFVAKQMKNMSDTVTCTTPLIDETTTVIDGGRIITGSITANQIGAGQITAQKLDAQALYVNGFPLAGQDITSQIPAARRYTTFDYLKVVRTPYMVFVFLECVIVQGEPLEEIDIIDLPVTNNTPARLGVAFSETLNSNDRVISGIMKDKTSGWATLYAHNNAGNSHYATSFVYPV